jgi:hypothetical protein
MLLYPAPHEEERSAGIVSFEYLKYLIRVWRIWSIIKGQTKDSVCCRNKEGDARYEPLNQAHQEGGLVQ